METVLTNTVEASAPDDAHRAEVVRLEARIAELTQEVADLEIALTTAVEHGDAIEADLQAANGKLHGEIRERMLAERRLSQVLDAVREQKDDLEVLVQTITEHSDEIDSQWLQRYSEVEALSRLDPLTGIANRRGFDDVLVREWRRCGRSGLPLALIVCDIDFFKQYNDRYGHPAGDRALTRVARVIAAACRRDPDFPARVGGEEFAVILPDTDAEHAAQVAAMINESLRALKIEHEGSVHAVMTLSLGAAARVPNPDESPEGLYAEADRLLYEAKKDGRNRVCSRL